MPTYIFKNKKSDEIFEVQMRISELDEYKKKNPKLLQVPTAPSFRLKGSGWYETDFKTSNRKNLVEGKDDKPVKDDKPKEDKTKATPKKNEKVKDKTPKDSV